MGIIYPRQQYGAKIQGKYGDMVAAKMNIASDALVESNRTTKRTNTVIALTVHNSSHW